MGWFLMNEGEQAKLQGFSSPLGDGLVLDERNKKRSSTIFSSPLGDGLVHWIQSRTVPEIAFSSPSGDGLVRK